jgi:uncharacterized membrane-anchored protein
MARGFDVQASKVPEVTLGFWIIKILATTLGETGGDSVTMTWLKADVIANSGYLVGSGIFLSTLIVLVGTQIAAKKFHPFLYWATIVASTTFGTTLAGATRSLGIGYAAPVRLPHARAGALVLVRRHHLSEHREHATSGSILLDGDYVLSNTRNCSRRLGRRYWPPRI